MNGIHSSSLRENGEIGRHKGLKIPCSLEREGSSPSSPTMKEFKLFNTIWKIEYVDSIETNSNGEEQFSYGQANPLDHTIKIARYVGDVKQSKEDIKLTLLHELVHIIFITGQYNSCNSDEPLVEWIANCLMSLKDQKIL